MMSSVRLTMGSWNWGPVYTTIGGEHRKQVLNDLLLAALRPIQWINMNHHAIQSKTILQ